MDEEALGAERSSNARLGDELNGLLESLQHAGLKVGPREYVAAHTLVAELIARGRVHALGDLRFSLRPLLARSAEDRETFDLVFAAATDAPSPPSSSDLDPRKRRLRLWPVYAAAAILALLAGVFVHNMWWHIRNPVEPIIKGKTLIHHVLPPALHIDSPLPPVTKVEALDRIAKAAACFGSAPTLEELSRGLARVSDQAPPAAPWCTKKEETGPAKGIGWPAESYAVKLHEWTGLPLSLPLAIYGAAGKDATMWARLALALERIEAPGNEPSFAKLLENAKASITSRTPEQTPLTYRLAEAFSHDVSKFKDLPHTKELIKTAQELAKIQRLGGKEGTPAAADPFYVLRALAITPGIKLPADFYESASWRPAQPLSGVHYAPRWAPLVAFLFPLAFALFWFANSLALRKAYLRRRPPHLPPLHMNIVSEIRHRITGHKGKLLRLAQRLLVRSPEVIGQIDVAATIAATLAKGAGHLTPVYTTVYRTPEYLALIERSSAADQETERMRALIHRLRDMVPVAVYTFQGDPVLLDSELGGRPIPIEQALAAHGDHRLIVFGSGEGLLDPISLRPRPAAQQLMHFQHRALLTPIPVAEWGREEFALARELEMPIGRATAEGMERLAELLGLDGAPSSDPIDPEGDGLARALPEMLRVHPDKFFYSMPPSGLEIPQLLRELRNFLDGPGFEWLCALAVYPAVQWDLTLYLGVSLAEVRGGEPARQPLYREDRIAALTQLPWLREGAMPVWLRRALTGELGRAGRADEVRDALKALIGRAKELGERRTEGDVVLSIAREQPIEGFDPERLYDDEVLLDFMARGRVEDFALPRRSILEAILPRGLLDRIGVPGLIAGAVALVYAAAAWWLTPKTDGLPWGLGGEAPNPTVAGAWLPLMLLTLAGGIALGLANPSGTARLFRQMLSRVPVLALSFALLMLILAGLTWVPAAHILSYLQVGSESNYGIWAALSLASLAAAKILLRPFLFGDTQAGSSFLLRIASLGLQTLLLWLGTLACIEGVQGYSAHPSWFFATGGLIALLISGAALAATKSAFYQETHRPVRPALKIWGGLRLAAALALILPAVIAARIVSTASVPLSATAAGTGAVAETPDGRFLAIGGTNGKVQIYDTESPASPFRTIGMGPGFIASLAIAHRGGRVAERSLIVAATYTSGRVAVRQADNARPEELAWAEQDDVQSYGQVPFAALGSGGRLLVAVEGRDGQARLIAGPREEQRLTLSGSSPVTALIALDTGRFAAATMDGAVYVVSVSHYGRLAKQFGRAVLRFEKSRTRRLIYEEAGDLLTAIADDGTIKKVKLVAGRLPAQLKGGAASQMALGASVHLRPLTSAQERYYAAHPGQSFQECEHCPEMVVVPAGRFTMGSPDTEPGHQSEESPQHQVRISKPFAAGRFSVTFAEWDACVADGGCGGYSPDDQGWGRGDRPVIYVSWDDAKAYVKWLSNKTGKEYRLLSEAEREYVTRAGTTTPFWWGTSISTDQANYDGTSTYGGGSKGEYRRKTLPVNSFAPNPWGLYQVHGNVWEWVEDCWHDNYIDAPSDGSAWTAENCSRRVLRGGSGGVYPQYLRAAFRYRYSPGNRVSGISFRLARTLNP